MSFWNSIQLVCLINIFFPFYYRNIRTAFRDTLTREGIYMVDPLSDKTNLKKSMQPVKLLSVEGLKKALRSFIQLPFIKQALFFVSLTLS